MNLLVYSYCNSGSEILHSELDSHSGGEMLLLQVLHVRHSIEWSL